MWRIDNRTPFAAERAWVRDRDGSEIWLVAVKATFDIRPDGTTAIAEEQPPVLRVPEYHGEPGKSSIKYESDLVLTKQTTDRFDWKNEGKTEQQRKDAHENALGKIKDQLVNLRDALKKFKP